jgi:hypothetical protein
MYLRIFITLTALLYCVPCSAVPVQVSITDSRGAPLKSAMIILQDLTHQERELTRVLTGEEGNADLPELSPGLYRVITTYPYSHWQTVVREFLVRDKAVRIELRMSEMQGYDDLPVSIGQLTLHVLGPNGAPVGAARVLVRDAYADPHSEHWGNTNAQGTVVLELTLKPAVILIVDRDQLYEFPTSGLETERTVRLK